MKKFVYGITIILFMFVVNNMTVNAGVCNGISKGEYCSSDNSSLVSNVEFTKLDEKLAYFLPLGFDAKISFNNRTVQDTVAFCIDPGLSSPNTSYKYYRELNLKNNFDKGTYAMYQKLINSYQYSQKPGNASDNRYINLYRATFEAAIRFWALKYGYAYVANNVNFQYDLSRFITCAETKEIDSSIYTSDTYKSHLKNFPASNRKANDYNFYSKDCFEVNSTNTWNTSLVKTFYDAKDNSISWNDPFENSSSVTSSVAKSGDNYKITFDIEFSNFFDNSDAVPGLKLNAAKFESTILIKQNNNDYKDCSDGTCNATITTNLNRGIKVTVDEDISTLKYEITLTPSQYQEIYDNGASIVLKYNYNHPMNLDNMYFTRYNVNSENPVYQRMLILYNHNEERTSEIILDELGNLCEHRDTNIFINRIGEKVGFNDFLTSCGCNKVVKEKLDSVNLNTFKTKCETSGEPAEVTGNFSACTLDSPSTENYEIKYKYKQENINKYCNLNCTETIGFNEVTGRYKNIRAGGYLELNNYPTTLATKFCKLNLDYKKWYADYEEALTEAVKAYNTYAKDKAIEAAYSHEGSYSYSKTCSKTVTDSEGNESTLTDTSCGYCPFGYSLVSTGGICDTDYYYNESTYNKITFNFDSVSKTVSYNKIVVDTGVSGWLDNKKIANSNDLGIKVGELNDVIDNLNNCVTKIKNTNYNYQEDLNFYYEQTLVGGSKIKNNDNDLKESRIREDDKGYNLINKTYYSLGTSGISPKTFFMFNTNEDVYEAKRTFTVKSTYTIDDKYTQSFVGGFGTKKDFSSDNLIKLGKVYNIDENAISKSDNKYYFEFKALGDNNQIYEYYNSTDAEDLKRYCTYETINDLVCIPNTGDLDCDDPVTPGDTENPSSKILFKIVDPNNIDPNGRMGNQGFENWKDKEVVKEAIETSDTFNPENLEYSFELDSATIKSIREYNERNDYLNYDEYDCDNYGNYCKSNFIDDAVDDSFAKIVNGRKEWKNFDINSNTIVEKDVRFVS